MLAIVALTGISLAAPSITQRDTQSCHCSDRGVAIGAYGVYISVPYRGGVGCNDVYGALQENDAFPSSWQCIAADDGNTQLYFNAVLWNGKGINAALVCMYPNIDSGFNCPDY